MYVEKRASYKMMYTVKNNIWLKDYFDSMDLYKNIAIAKNTAKREGFKRNKFRSIRKLGIDDKQDQNPAIRLLAYNEYDFSHCPFAQCTLNGSVWLHFNSKYTLILLK